MFAVLLPELWVHIRNHLVTKWDARSRVALQRTCKEAAALDPGTFFAPVWQKGFDDIMKASQDIGWRWRRSAAFYDMCKEFHAAHLLDEPWWRPPGFVDVATVSDAGVMLDIHFQWNVTPEGMEAIYLYVRDDPGQDGWALHLTAFNPPVGSSNVQDEGRLTCASLRDILLAAPTLCLGIDGRLIRAWAAAHRLSDFLNM